MFDREDHPIDCSQSITLTNLGEKMGAWEDGFAAGYSAGLRADTIRFRDEVQDLAKKTRKGASRPKRVGKKDPKMARALRKANAMGRKKSGGFKKGWSQGKIMKKAHQLRRKM